MISNSNILIGIRRTAAAALEFDAEATYPDVDGGSEEEESESHAPNDDGQTYEPELEPES
jgi:hypothetical protein